MPTVRLATHHELPQVGALLAAAFADDPIWNHLSPDAARWNKRAPGWYTAYATANHHGPSEVLVDDEVRGAAVWASPGHWRPSLRETLRVALPSFGLFGRGTITAMRTLGAVEKCHPRDPEHWYLAILGTHPAHQGHGVGSALITAITDRCDEQGLGSYLESSKEGNVPYYERHGFVVQERIRPGDGPPMWTMWRDPRA